MQFPPNPIAPVWQQGPERAELLDLLAAIGAWENDRLSVTTATPAKQTAKRRRREGEPRVTALTPTQAEAVHLVGEHKGNIAAAARAAGRKRQAMNKSYKTAMKKMGKSAVREKGKTRALPTDRRGQADDAARADDED
jgi:hypothetical protein